MDYMIWMKKTSEILRNPTSSKWSENFWNCLPRLLLNNEQKLDIVFLGFISLAHLHYVLCRRSKLNMLTPIFTDYYFKLWVENNLN